MGRWWWGWNRWMRSKRVWRSWLGFGRKEATHDGRTWFSGSVGGLIWRFIGLENISLYVSLPEADGGASTALLPDVGGGGEVALDSGTGIFSQQSHLLQGFQFRGRGDFCA